MAECYHFLNQGSEYLDVHVILHVILNHLNFMFKKNSLNEMSWILVG